MSSVDSLVESREVTALAEIQAMLTGSAPLDFGNIGSAQILTSVQALKDIEFAPQQVVVIEALQGAGKGVALEALGDRGIRISADRLLYGDKFAGRDDVTDEELAQHKLAFPMAPGNGFISYQAVDKIIGLIREAQCESTFPTRVTPHADQITYQRCRNDQGVVIRKRMIKAGLDGSLFYEVPNAEAPIFVDGTNSSKLLSRIDNSVGVFNMLNPVEALFGALRRDLQDGRVTDFDQERVDFRLREYTRLLPEMLVSLAQLLKKDPSRAILVRDLEYVDSLKTIMDEHPGLKKMALDYLEKPELGVLSREIFEKTRRVMGDCFRA